MRKFIVNLFSNHFGIILAALNLCYFVSKINVFPISPFGKIFACANLPAFASAILSLEFVKIFIHRPSFSTEEFLGYGFLAVFIVLQWLFIAWIAKTLAARFRPKEI